MAERKRPHRAARGACRRFAPLTLLLLIVGLGAGAGTANAQGPLYLASPPTAGALYRDGQDGRYLLGGAWLYRADLYNVGVDEGWWGNVADTGGWSPVTVPNSYNANDLSGASMNGSVGWYRRDFTLPSNAFARYVKKRDRHWIIRFESVNYSATVWLNGREIGSHRGAYLPFELDLKGLRSGVNRLIVRVDDRRTGGDLPPGPGGGWWNFGGILREVYLRAVQRVDISQAQIRPLLPCPTCAATITEQATVRNLTGKSQQVSVKGFYNHTRLSFGSATIAPHATWTAQGSVPFKHPHLWSIDDPYLYRASITVNDSRGKRLARYIDYSGIRSITVTGDGRLELNGRPLNLRGVDLHEQALGSGAALGAAQVDAIMGWVNDLGAKIIRAHYPLNPEIDEAADRDGILLWSEIPVYKVASSYMSQSWWLSRAYGMLKTNILTNQNHPSVLTWSIGNELVSPASGAEANYIAGATALARKLDPTRPVALAVSGWPGLGCQAAYAPLQIIGYNDYFGWFDAGGGTTDDRDSLSPYLDSLRACYPKQALMVSEFGFDGDRNGPVEVRGTYAFQSDATAFHLGVFATKPWLSGAMYFALQDFAARPGWGGGNPLPDPPYVQKGPVDLQGNFKPLFGVMAAIYKGTQQIAPKSAASSVRHRSGRRPAL
jgi:beta-glucuronidase